MKSASKISVLAALSAIFITPNSQAWESLFDGETLNGWQAFENPDTWQVQDGALVAHGERSHLFYVGEVSNHDFRNFEFMADVMTRPGSNSGIYVHTEPQDSGWPAKGYELQVINSNPMVDPGEYVEHKMTGSIYAVRNTWKAPAQDNEWFNYRIVVIGRTIRTYINGELISGYTESEDYYRSSDKSGRALSSGTFALQGHDPGSVVYYKNLRVNPLPDDLPTPGTAESDRDFGRIITRLGSDNFYLMDLNVQLKGGLTREQALNNARRYGYTYGFTIDGGSSSGFPTDESLDIYLNGHYKPPQTFLGLRAIDPSWNDIYSEETMGNFDYVMVDALKFLSITSIPDQFIEEHIAYVERIANMDEVDIIANVAAMPSGVSERWTDEHTARVLAALAESGVAIEINDRLQSPGAEFIRKAKEAGVKFTFGSDNTGASDLGRLSYCIAMIQECNLETSDIWMPRKP